MRDSDITAALNTSLDGLRLLDHPYYRNWQEGMLEQIDLARYATEYRHFERGLPEVLAAVADRLGDGRCRRLVEQNLDDETSRPRPHIELFEQFAASVGASEETAPSRATAELVGLYRSAAQAGPVPALAVIAAYEIQAGEIADTKAAALARHHLMGEAATEFWTVHGAMEGDHAAWTLEALEALDAPVDTVEMWAGRSAQAWWAFLDERESERLTSSVA